MSTVETNVDKKPADTKPTPKPQTGLRGWLHYALDSGPSPAAVGRAREAVFAAGDGTGPTEPDEDLLHSAWWVRPQWEKNLATYQQRLAAVRELEVSAPDLDAQAASLAAEVATRKAFVASPLAQVGSIAELLATLQMAADASLASLPNALTAFQLATVKKDSDARRMRDLAAEARSRARATLSLTASPEAHAAVRAIRDKISSLELAIKGRQQVLDGEDEIARCIRRCERLSRGERVDVDPWAGGDYRPMNRPDRTVAQLYRDERRRLNALRGQATGRAEAEADNARDRKKIAELQAQAAEAEKRFLDPRDMAWVDY
jgi:DNA repair exonuclease SbcCD ATPase subunit